MQRPDWINRFWVRTLAAVAVWAIPLLSVSWSDDVTDARKVEELRQTMGMTDAQFETLLKIIDEGRNRNQTMVHLTYLCEQIGPRLTGSERLERANNWVADQFRSWGLENVHLHQWGTIPVRFDRGPSTGKMTKPVARNFEFTTQAWSAGTDGPQAGHVIREPQTAEELEAVAEKLQGAWILRPAGKAPSPFLSRMYSAGIHGVMVAAQGEIVHTGGVRGLTQLDIKDLNKEVQVFIRRSDYDAINSRLMDEQEVEVEFDLQNKFTAGPIPVYNTIGEIRGTELPDEVVIISAHLDSWDGPGSQGTVDNGTGSSVTMEAARILAAVGAKPKRTIRFILWSGEEQGLLGSRAYVNSLSDEEKAKISAVFVDDSGTNQQASLTCTEAMADMLRVAIAPMNFAFPDVPITLNVQRRLPARGASDHQSFINAGIPGFFWGKTGRADYRYAWHTQNDRLDQAVPEYLVKNSTVSAIVAYVLSEAETLLSREMPEGDDEEERPPPRRRRDREQGREGGGEGGREGGGENREGGG